LQSIFQGSFEQLTPRVPILSVPTPSRMLGHLQYQQEGAPKQGSQQATLREIRVEYAKIENAQLEAAVNEATDDQLRELNNLQLAFVGGGTVEFILG
ncbi:MAG TPA: hypothetical protein VF386_14540, partial [Usitatibacter sp.]